MNDLAQEIMRKIRIRQFAQENLGLTTSEYGQYESGDKMNIREENQKLYQILNENIQQADQSKTQDGYWVLTSHRKILGKLIIFIKKVVRKLLKVFMGWYIFPIFHKQSFFNGKMVNVVSIMRDIQLQNDQKSALLLERIQKLEQIINDNELKLKEEKKKDKEDIFIKVKEFIRKTDEIENDFSNFKKEIEKHLEELEKTEENKFENLQEAVKSQFENLMQSNRELLTKIEEQSQKISALSQQQADQMHKIGYMMAKLNLPEDIAILEKATPMDYFDFENHFRGPRENVKNSQRHYVEYYKINGGGEILDIGCGRGEFLELMYDYGIPAHGIDVYQPFVDYCSKRGFRVQKADALSYLSGLEDASLGGIFMSQVAEHLDTDYLRALIETAYLKLKPGCHFILETPNPECLATYRNFYLDLDHIKPVHYLTLEYLFLKNGFENVTRYDNEFSHYPYSFDTIKEKNIEKIDQFNESIEHMNELISGCRDYTLIARK